MPMNPYLYMNRSVLESAVGHRAAAVEEARRAVEIAPQNQLAQHYYQEALRNGGEGGEMLMERGLDALYQRSAF